MAHGNPECAAAIAMEWLEQANTEYGDDACTDSHACGLGTYCDKFANIIEDVLVHPQADAGLRQDIADELSDEASEEDNLHDYGVFDFKDFAGKIKKAVDTSTSSLDILDSFLDDAESRNDKESLTRYIIRKIDLLRSKRRKDEAEQTREKYIHLYGKQAVFQVSYNTIPKTLKV